MWSSSRSCRFLSCIFFFFFFQYVHIFRVEFVLSCIDIVIKLAGNLYPFCVHNICVNFIHLYWLFNLFIIYLLYIYLFTIYLVCHLVSWLSHAVSDFISDHSSFVATYAVILLLAVYFYTAYYTCLLIVTPGIILTGQYTWYFVIFLVVYI